MKGGKVYNKLVRELLEKGEIKNIKESIRKYALSTKQADIEKIQNTFLKNVKEEYNVNIERKKYFINIYLQ